MFRSCIHFLEEVFAGAGSLKTPSSLSYFLFISFFFVLCMWFLGGRSYSIVCGISGSCEVVDLYLFMRKRSFNNSFVWESVLVSVDVVLSVTES